MLVTRVKCARAAERLGAPPIKPVLVSLSPVRRSLNYGFQFTENRYNGPDFAPHCAAYTHNSYACSQNISTSLGKLAPLENVMNKTKL